MYGRGIEGNVFMLSNYSTIRDMSSFPCLIAAGAFFMIFKKITIHQSKVINFIATNTFGIYLLHNHTVSIPIFWRGIFGLNVIFKTRWYLLYSFFLVIAIFVVGISIECVRKRVEDAILGKKKSKEFFEKIDKIINCFFQEKSNKVMSKSQ